MLSTKGRVANEWVESRIKRNRKCRRTTGHSRETEIQSWGNKYMWGGDVTEYCFPKKNCFWSEKTLCKSQILV